MTDLPSDCSEFLEQHIKASTTFVNVGFGPLERVATRTSPASIFGPQGDAVVGADEFNTVNARGAENFAPGSKNHFNILHMAAGDSIAYWAGIQRSTVQMKGQAEAIPMDLRVTEVFRREGDVWKLIHRHADPLKTKAEG